jgi:broad specificity phosphatase PhoE
MRDWYAELTADTVVVAHGGTARALMVALGVATPRAAPNTPIGQGVVYRLAAGSMALHR